MGLWPSYSVCTKDPYDMLWMLYPSDIQKVFKETVSREYFTGQTHEMITVLL